MGLALSLIDEDASAAGFAGATTAATMMAVVHRRYGRPDVLEHTEVDKPVVGDDDVLVRVHAAAVHPGDYFIMTGVPTVVRLAFGLRRPRNGIRGMDVAGRVEAVGRSVQGLEPGDAVFGRSSTGTLAEYTRAPADNFAPKPVNLSMEQAAAIPVSAFTALQALREIARVQPGQTVLITGASGGVGTFAVQIAKAFGARVTGVCSTRNVDLVRSVGADHVIDYTRTDFTRTGQRYEVILDNVEAQSLSAARRALTPTGTLIPNNGKGGRSVAGVAVARRRNANAGCRWGPEFGQRPKYEQLRLAANCGRTRLVGSLTAGQTRLPTKNPPWV